MTWLNNRMERDKWLSYIGRFRKESWQGGFAAALQAAQAGDAPVLIRIETKAGHGAGKPTAELIEESADEWGFLVKVLKLGTKG